jgi:tetratricopeptide (TPR) repeat protein
MGGVGLGLPYTGPTGEPIFGLTPEQRLAQASTLDANKSIAMMLEPETVPVRKSRKKWALYGAIAGVAIVAGVVIAVATSGGGGDGETGEMSAIASQANEALNERGDAARAIAILEQNKTAIESDAMAQLVMGHARSARAENALALDAYTRALTLDPTLENRDRLRANLATIAQDKDKETLVRAFDLWVRTTDPEARVAIAKAAVAENVERRRAVVPVIEAHKIEGIDWWIAYSYDLQQGKTCEIRKEAVTSLRALGDPRAIEALERALVRKGQYGVSRNKPINNCLAEDARSAIKYLEGLADK